MGPSSANSGGQSVTSRPRGRNALLPHYSPPWLMQCSSVWVEYPSESHSFQENYDDDDETIDDDNNQYADGNEDWLMFQDDDDDY